MTKSASALALARRAAETHCTLSERQDPVKCEDAGSLWEALPVQWTVSEPRWSRRPPARGGSRARGRPRSPARSGSSRNRRRRQGGHQHSIDARGILQPAHQSVAPVGHHSVVEAPGDDVAVRRRWCQPPRSQPATASASQAYLLGAQAPRLPIAEGNRSEEAVGPPAASRSLRPILGSERRRLAGERTSVATPPDAPQYLTPRIG